MQIYQNTIAKVVDNLAFGPSGQMLVAGSDGGFDVWNLAGNTKRFIATTKVAHSVFTFTIDPLGRWLYRSKVGEGLRIYDLSNGIFHRLPGREDDQHVVAVAASADGVWLAVGRGVTGNNRLECWHLAERSLRWRFPSPIDFTGFHGLAFSPDGMLLAAAERKQGWGQSAVVLRDAQTGKEAAQLGLAPEAMFPHTVFTPDGKRLVVWTEQMVHIWDVASRKLVGTVKQVGRANFRGLAVHPHGRLFATAGGDRHLRLWDLTTLRQRQAFKWNIGKLHSVAFSPDGMLGATGGEAGQVVVWDMDE